MFESVYDSPWVATFALAIVALVAFALWLRRQPFLAAYVAGFTIVALGDAVRSGAWSPLLGSRWDDAVGLFFVLVGDYRYFLVMERSASMPDGKPLDATPLRAWLSAFAWMAIVPLVCLALGRLFPTRFVGRWAYLVWELLFVVLAVGLRLFVYPRRLARASDAVRRWLYEISYFEIALYALWALADVTILAGADAGFALRIVPNLLYYGLFVAFVGFRAPPEVASLTANDRAGAER